jgi:hypothetical protein
MKLPSNIPDWATTISGIAVLVAGLSVILNRAIKHWLHESLAELRPNHGSSTYDVIRKAAEDASRAAHAAERAADQAMDVREQIDQVLNRVSALEQVVVSWTPTKVAKKAPVRKRS